MKGNTSYQLPRTRSHSLHSQHAPEVERIPRSPFHSFTHNTPYFSSSDAGPDTTQIPLVWPRTRPTHAHRGAGGTCWCVVGAPTGSLPRSPEAGRPPEGGLAPPLGGRDRVSQTDSLSFRPSWLCPRSDSSPQRDVTKRKKFVVAGRYLVCRFN